MNRNFETSNVSTALPLLLGALLRDGEEFPSDGGLTRELMHVGVTLTKPWQREILISTRKANIAAQIYETMWVLSGRNDVAALANYLPRAADFSDDGETWRSGYGPRLRNYEGTDQLAYVAGLLRENPGTRRAVISLWDPIVDTTPGLDTACNNWLSFSSRLGYLDLHVAVRSNDAIWGWSGINTFEWSVLQELVARWTGLLVGSLHFSITSFHVYQRHWKKAREIIQNPGYFVYDDSPRFDAKVCENLPMFDALAGQWFETEELIRYGRPDAPRAVEEFPEPMMRSWLRVLQWWWSGNQGYLDPLFGTRLHEACGVGLSPAGVPQVEQLKLDTDHIMSGLLLGGAFPVSLREHINSLHAEKHAAYGDSWRRRGEIGILSNIARKVDRLEIGSSTSDESQLDTAIDLVVYVAKYVLWLCGDEEAAPEDVARYLESVTASRSENTLGELLDRLYAFGTGPHPAKVTTAEELLSSALDLAQSLWR